MKKMEKAFNDLANTIIPQDSCNFQRTSLEDVRHAALEIERELASRQSLRNMRRLMPLFSGLEHYAATMGVVCNGTPFLRWVWAPITLILRIASEYVEAFEQIIKGYSRIAGSLKRFEILGEAFSDNSEFGFTLATFYEDILEFHRHAYKFVRRNGWRILFLTSSGRFQRRFESILDNMERHGSLIDQEASARNIAEAREMRHDLRSWREETLDNLSRQEDIQFEKQYQSILSWLKKDQSDQLAISDTIMAEISKYPDVYICIRDCAKVKAWLQRNTAASLLWVQGIPGCGKTFIAAQLIRYLRIAKMPFLYNFCSYSYATSLAYDQIIRSLISQVVMGDNDLVAFVCNDYVFGNKLPTLHVLEELLENLLMASSSEPRQTEYKWVILDGLDECSPEQQCQMLRFTKRMIAKLSSSSSSGNTVCKFLIASQFSPEISRRIRKEHTLSLSTERSLIDKAIQQYVKQRLQPLYQKFRSLELSEQQFQNMAETVVKKADGMFLYARLVLDYLSINIFMNEEEIQSSLDLLPTRLTDFYEKILAQMLGKLDERSINHIKCVFGWVAFQKRPLKRLEFLSVSFSQGDPHIKTLAPDYIFDICGSFLDQRPDTTITFVHSSMKTFLRSTSIMLSIKEEETTMEHGLAAITCLLSGFDVFRSMIDDHSRRLRTVKGIHGLHVYSTEFWTDYLLSASQLLGGLREGSLLLTQAYALAKKIESEDRHNDSGTAKSISTNRTECLDDRLENLERFPPLFKHVKDSLATRSLQALESNYISQQPGETNMCNVGQGTLKPSSATNRILLGYQETVRYLLEQDDFPGVSAEALKSFKCQFSSALYTCRLRTCPRATCGFDNQELLHRHELSHARRYPCNVSGCQTPPFGSAEALRRHNTKYHAPAPLAKIKHRRARGHSGGVATSETNQPQGLELGFNSHIAGFRKPNQVMASGNAFISNANTETTGLPRSLTLPKISTPSKIGVSIDATSLVSPVLSPKPRPMADHHIDLSPTDAFPFQWPDTLVNFEDEMFERNFNFDPDAPDFDPAIFPEYSSLPRTPQEFLPISDSALPRRNEDPFFTPTMSGSTLKSYTGPASGIDHPTLSQLDFRASREIIPMSTPWNDNGSGRSLTAAWPASEGSIPPFAVGRSSDHNLSRRHNGGTTVPLGPDTRVMPNVPDLEFEDASTREDRHRMPAFASWRSPHMSENRSLHVGAPRAEPLLRLPEPRSFLTPSQYAPTPTKQSEYYPLPPKVPARNTSES
ncbi:NACHTdomain protein [Colletotrichum kahawae]|uniref:NACHTdomain protein n=1 Tax=Colletotrichum kahawae TaxID=34407 RepID=A0AAD9XVT6_COLKA|nr:NACHTdomain protein [Colletotrichum kahawae]